MSIYKNDFSIKNAIVVKKSQLRTSMIPNVLTTKCNYVEYIIQFSKIKKINHIKITLLRKISVTLILEINMLNN